MNMTINIFEIATRQALRFQLPEGIHPSGLLSVEQLWKIKKEALITYEEALQDEVDKYGKSGRRRTISKTSEQEQTELRLAIVTHILDVKEEEEKTAQLEFQNAEHNAKIDRLMAKKKEAELENLSIEELAKLKL